ncbi:hypothetical protein PYW07_013322 [Mythimna separata]|uniref:Uncharacterized protein n=1 Tax=Mythimna separata TaxID=271217 RepID=A0AAD7Y689_MYTSE|nr:hypothetical protein PYW07_013322 [Mythimna separata]
MGTTLIDAQVDQLTESLLSSYHTSCPETLPRDSPGKQPWWGADLERKRGKQNTPEIATLRKPDNTLTSSPEEARRILVETHFPDCVFAQVTDHSEENQTTSEDDWLYACRMIALEKLQWAIHSFHPSKAPGADGVLHYYSGVGRRWRHV